VAEQTIEGVRNVVDGLRRAWEARRKTLLAGAAMRERNPTEGASL
jgi:hypothetical protein